MEKLIQQLNDGLDKLKETFPYNDYTYTTCSLTVAQSGRKKIIQWGVYNGTNQHYSKLSLDDALNKAMQDTPQNAKLARIEAMKKELAALEKEVAS